MSCKCSKGSGAYQNDSLRIEIGDGIICGRERHGSPLVQFDYLVIEFQATSKDKLVIENEFKFLIW